MRLNKSTLVNVAHRGEPSRIWFSHGAPGGVSSESGFQVRTTADDRTLKLLNIIDEHTREATRTVALNVALSDLMLLNTRGAASGQWFVELGRGEVSGHASS